MGKIVYLSEEQLSTLVTAGTITANNQTVTYSADDIYLTPGGSSSGLSDIGWDGVNKKITKMRGNTSTQVVSFTAGNNITLTPSSNSLEIAASLPTLTNVSFTNTTSTNSEYPVLFKYSTSTTTTAAGTRFISATGKSVTVNGSTGNLTVPTINKLTLTAATTGFTIAGGTTSKTLTVGESYTLGAACEKAITDNSSAADVTSADTNLITGRTLYYQLANKGYKTSSGVTSVTWNNSSKKIQQSVDSGTATDVLEFEAGSNITLTPASGKLTIAATGGVEIGTTSSTAAAGDHTHGNITNNGSVGSGNNLLVTSSGTIDAGAAISSAVSSQSQSTKFLREDGTWSIPSYTSYTNETASSGGTDLSLVSTGEKYTWNNKQEKMAILSYGSSTWQDFLDVYNNNAVVYCRASSNSNPGTGTQGRMAFMAYLSLNSSNVPTSVEFQYYRSVNSHSSSQMSDQVFIYKLESNNTWSVTTREASLKQLSSGVGINVSYNNNAATVKTQLVSETALTNAATAATEVSGRVYPVAVDANDKLAVNVPWENTDTHRAIKVDGTEKLSSSSTTALDLVAGSNISLTESSGAVTIANTYSYTHPSGDGNLHVPANGTSNTGKFLKATGTAGSYEWSDLPSATSSVAGITTIGASGGAAEYSHTHSDYVEKTGDTMTGDLMIEGATLQLQENSSSSGYWEWSVTSDGIELNYYTSA